MRLLTRPRAHADDTLRALVVELGGDAEGRNRAELVEQVVDVLHEQILFDELPILTGLGDDPPVGTSVPASEPDRTPRQGGR